MVIQNSGNHEASVDYKKEPRNEIEEYLDCRYLSACEACWRIFQFEIQYRSPSVIALQVHLPGQQAITLSDKQYLPDLLRRKDLQHTMFTQWMRMNEINPEARQLTYAEFPTKFVWNKCIREWDDSKNDSVRKKAWTRRQQGYCIGRIVYVHLTAGEKYYLRVLLNFVRGPRSFEEIRTINGVTYGTFKQACHGMGILSDDNE